jgi:hypothetical protein
MEEFAVEAQRRESFEASAAVLPRP